MVGGNVLCHNGWSHACSLCRGQNSGYTIQQKCHSARGNLWYLGIYQPRMVYFIKWYSMAMTVCHAWCWRIMVARFSFPPPLELLSHPCFPRASVTERILCVVSCPLFGVKCLAFQLLLILVPCLFSVWQKKVHVTVDHISFLQDINGWFSTNLLYLNINKTHFMLSCN